MRRPLILCVDFDGTMVEHQFPDIGPPVPYAAETVRELQARGDQIILHTVRSDHPNRQYLSEAVTYMTSIGVTLYAVNDNPAQRSWSDSPKVFCDWYIDDMALGCPLVEPIDGTRAYVDWRHVRMMLGLSPFDGLLPHQIPNG